MSMLKLAEPVVFDSSSLPAEDKIEFLEWVDPDASEFQSNGLQGNCSQETSFPIISVTNPNYNIYPNKVFTKFDPNLDVICNDFSNYARTKTFKKKEPQKKIGFHSRRRKFVAKRTDFDKGTRSKSETGFRGVRFSTNGCRFRATVNVNKKPFNVGTFDTASVAAEEYDKALIRITHGRVERSRLNFPNKWTSLYQQVRQDHSKSCTEVDTEERPYKRQKLTHSSNLW